MVRFVALGLCLVACAEPAARRGAPPPPSAAGGAERGVVLARTEPPPPEEHWVEAVRAADFQEADRQLRELPKARARTPEIRFVRARVAEALGDHSTARRLLEGLSKELPLLSKEIARTRAESALAIGPFDEAAHYFALQGDAESLVKAALALERAGKLPEAKTSLDRAIGLLGNDGDAASVATRVRARSARARIEGLLHAARAAEGDYRWLAVEAADSDAGTEALAALAALSPPVHLTAEQELARSRHLAEASRIEEALAAIDRAAASKTDKPPASVLLRARGSAYYLSRADYAKAAEILEQSARLDPKQAARDSFFAARALARADEDARAIERYERLARQFPSSAYADEARYQAARLRFLLGQWDPAVHAFRSYLAVHSKRRPGRFASMARYELSLAMLAGKHPAEAATLFESQAASETDPLHRALLHELEGAALVDSGDRDRASAELRAVMQERPLSFPALAGASRLVQLGETLPPWIERDTGSRPAPPLVVELPARAALLAKLGFTREAAQELAGREQEIEARYAPRGAEALCIAYGMLGAGAERYRVGRNAIKSDALDHAPTDATRWAWECLYPTPFADIVREAESERALPHGLLHAIMRQESGFKADAVSPARAVGLLQLIPDTAGKVASELGLTLDPSRLALPAYNVELGAYYVHKVLGTFGGRVALAAAAYNAGPRAVSRWLAAAENLPLDLWVARIPYAETRGYVARVIGNLARYSYLHGGAEAVPRLVLALPKGMRAGPEDY